jgi:hypothetical protein
VGLRRRGSAAAEQLADEQVVRDAEESLVAALQESDTAVEALGDSGVDARADGSRRRWTIGIAGTLLALLGFMVARRRR